jgi:hypothetical protein
MQPATPLPVVLPSSMLAFARAVVQFGDAPDAEKAARYKALLTALRKYMREDFRRRVAQLQREERRKGRGF